MVDEHDYGADHQPNTSFVRQKYDNFAAIDWIVENSKERRRQQLLLLRSGSIIGRIRWLLDMSKVWSVLIITGVASGLLAGSIDVASDWLSDLKYGFCASGLDGGNFYLNKSFCCWGYEGIFMLGYTTW